MKKIWFLAIATAMLGMTFTSCDKENEEENDANVKVSRCSCRVPLRASEYDPYL